METTSSPKRTIYEVSDSDFEDSVDKEKKSKVECQICNEPAETSELVECQTIKKSSAEVSHSVCVKCFSKMNKCPFCRTEYDQKQPVNRPESPDYVPPSPVLYQEEEEEAGEDDTSVRYNEFMRKVKAVGNSIRLMALYPLVRDRVRAKCTRAFEWASILSSSSLYNYQFFEWVMEQEARVYGNPWMLHQVVDSNLRLEGLQLILFDKYKGLLQLRAVHSNYSMISRIFSTWCERSPQVLAEVVRWYRDTDLAKLLVPTDLVKAGLHDVPWAVVSQTVQDLGLALGRVDVNRILAGVRQVPPLDMVKGLGELDPQATWNEMKGWIEGKALHGHRIGLSRPYLEALKAIRPRSESVSLWTQGQYDVTGFQRNALIRQVMPEAVKTTFVNLAEDGKVGVAPRGNMGPSAWEPVLPTHKPASNDFFFVDCKHPRDRVIEAKLPGVAPNEKFVIVYYHNEHPRQYRVYVSIKAQGNTGLDRYLDDHCLPLPGTDNGRPFDGLWVPNAQFIVALKNRPHN